MLKPEHYADMPMDIIEFCQLNGLDFNQGNVVKYICRYRKKNGLEDLEKAREYIDRMIEFEKEQKAQDVEQKTQEQATNNCIEKNKRKFVGVILVCGKIKIKKPTLKSAAKYLASIYGKSFEHYKYLLRLRKPRVYDFNVLYLS